MKHFIVFLLFIPIHLLAQQKVVFEDEFKKSFRTKPKLDIKLDNRFSFIRNNDVRTLGIKVGLNFNRNFKVGMGVNLMLLSVEKKYYDEKEVLIPVELSYFYYSPYFEYVYFNSKKWEFSLCTQLGFGNASYNTITDNDTSKELVKSVVLSYEPAMLIDYKISKWVGVGTGVGYRLVYYKSPGVNEKFSSPEVIIKLKIYLGEIVRTITGKELQID